jgi:argininosuccinate lyase
MEHLIRKGVPMRTAHETVGKLVALCDSKSCRLVDLSIDDFRGACDRLDQGVYGVLGVQNAVAALSSYGSGGKQAVEEQLARWRTRFSDS